MSFLPRQATTASAFVVMLSVAACGGSTPSGGAVSSPSPTPPPNVLAKSETVAGASMVILVDANGMTLYRWKKDTGTGKVGCVAACAAIWPPFILPAGATKPVGGSGVTGTLSTLSNPDGKGLQVTYNGWPLYFFSKDKAPGDTSGQGVAGNWFVVTPDQATNA